MDSSHAALAETTENPLEITLARPCCRRMEMAIPGERKRLDPLAAPDLVSVSPKARFYGWLIALVIRLFSMTLRYKLTDRAGITKDDPDERLIWAFWHNRMFALPIAYRRYFSHRTGAVLTSASRDGEVLAATMQEFGCAAVRGSSSRRGTQALMGLMRWIEGGYDVCITPDGPRGPRYRLSPGMIKLAQKTGARILPIHVTYENAWKLKSWDRFRIPKPFSKVSVTLGPYLTVVADAEDDAFERERARIEQVLRDDEVD